MVLDRIFFVYGVSEVFYYAMISPLPLAICGGFAAEFMEWERKILLNTNNIDNLKKMCAQVLEDYKIMKKSLSVLLFFTILINGTMIVSCVYAGLQEQSLIRDIIIHKYIHKGNFKV